MSPDKSVCGPSRILYEVQSEIDDVSNSDLFGLLNDLSDALMSCFIAFYYDFFLFVVS